MNFWTAINLLLFLCFAHLSAQESPLLYLDFDNTLNGTEEEIPLNSHNISYSEGLKGSSVYLESESYIEYASNDNIPSAEGTLSFWLKPDWDMATEASTILEFGGFGGILIFRNFKTLRAIFNRFAGNNQPEVGFSAVDITDWQKNEWFYVVIRWGQGKVDIFINGQLQDSQTYDFTLAEINAESFRIGSEGSTNFHLDEFEISGQRKSQSHILEDYENVLSIDAFSFKKELITRQATSLQGFTQLEMLEGWTEKIFIEANIGNSTTRLYPGLMDWTFSNANIADTLTFYSSHRYKAKRVGSTLVTGFYKGIQNTFQLNVIAPPLPVEFQNLGPGFTEADPCAIREVPVVAIRFMPTQNGNTIDPNYEGDLPAETRANLPLIELKERLNTFDKRVKYILTEGSKYRGYKNPDAIPYLGYKIVAVINVYEPMPLGKPTRNETNAYFPDYHQIIDRFGGENYVNNLGVKEFWLWGTHTDEVVPVESNMSSPTTGDISNSDRFEDDLPKYDHTYTLYNYNYGRSEAQAIHNHGHQIESILGAANLRQDGNISLFWGKFVGSQEDHELNCSLHSVACDDENLFRKGRCGWTHMPPNTTMGYDYFNPNSFASDIEDWQPDESGVKKMVNVNTWANLSFDWPDQAMYTEASRVENQWYLYWMQSIPGYGNAIPHGNRYMSNWWEFTADWDQAIKQNLGLYQNQQAEGPNEVCIVEDTTSTVSRIDKLSGIRSIQLNPNPIWDRVQLNIELAYLDEIKIQVWDIRGKKLFGENLGKKSSFSHSLDMSGIPSGVYFLGINLDGQRHVRRLVKK